MNDTFTHNITLENVLTNEVYDLIVPTIIGRHEDCDLVLAGERGASRKHARITVEDGLVVLMDLGSLNGTLVNGHEINRPVQLANGDILLFDKQEYRFAMSPAANDVSENVTVIANKDEIAKPENIKPAIHIVDDNPVFDKGSAAQDNVNNPIDFDDFDAVHHEPIAATSRPGGHISSNDLYAQTNQPERKSSVLRGLFVFSTLVALIIYIAYINGYQLPNVGS